MSESAQKIKLGDEVKDSVSGFTGVIVAEHRYLHGCTRMSVQPPIDKDGKLPDSASFDEPQLELVQSEKVVEGDHKTGGPEKDMPTARDEG